jgi:hypothetical protein
MVMEFLFDYAPAALVMGLCMIGFVMSQLFNSLMDQRMHRRLALRQE